MQDQSWLLLQYHNIFSLVRELGVPNPFTDWTTSGFWSPQGLTTEAPVFSKQQQYPTLLGQFIHTFPLFRYAFVKPTVVNTHPSKAAAVPHLAWAVYIHILTLSVCFRATHCALKPTVVDTHPSKAAAVPHLARAVRTHVPTLSVCLHATHCALKQNVVTCIQAKQQQYPTLLGQFMHTLPLFRYACMQYLRALKPNVVNTQQQQHPTLLGQFIHKFSSKQRQCLDCWRALPCALNTQQALSCTSCCCKSIVAHVTDMRP